ncbi:MAG TPA: Gfo/Idh/MocA family oxidoreductase [Armatimonadota bacterium]|nr:Gfo/Idh/MocA family oxidoreductase [Armatimonadota bacterium]
MTTDRPVKRLAIVGAGNHARDQHYPPMRTIDEIDLCAACDLDAEKLERVKAEYGVPATYTDYRVMIEAESPDAVVLVMRPMEMLEVALGCLDMGQHIMIEKPPGCSVADAEAILERSREAGCKVMVSVNRRFIPLIRDLKAMASERGVVQISSTYNKAGFTGDAWNWPAPLILADSIHNVDLMRWVGGDVAEVFSASAARDAEYKNAHSATVVYESGASGTINSHLCVGERVHQFEIHAMGMSAYLNVGDTRAPSCELYLDGERADPPTYEVDLPDDVGIENYYETLHFARWIAGDDVGEADLADVLDSVRLAEAISNGYRGPMV